MQDIKDRKVLRQLLKKDNIAKSRPQVVAKVRGPPDRPRRLHRKALCMFDSRMPASCGGYDVDCDDDDGGDSEDCPGFDARSLEAQGYFSLRKTVLARPS